MKEKIADDRFHAKAARYYSAWPRPFFRARTDLGYTPRHDFAAGRRRDDAPATLLKMAMFIRPPTLGLFGTILISRPPYRASAAIITTAGFYRAAVDKIGRFHYRASLSATMAAFSHARYQFSAGHR